MPEYHLQKRRTMSKITFFKDTEPSSLHILKAKTNNCWVAELKGLYIKQQTLLCGSRGHSTMGSPCERLLGWVPSTSQWEKCWGRENLGVPTFGQRAQCFGCSKHFTPKPFQFPVFFLSLQALLCLHFHPENTRFRPAALEQGHQSLGLI